MSSLQNKLTLDQSLFTNTDIEDDFELTVAEPFKRTYYFTYNGVNNAYSGKLYGNPETTGIETNNLVHEADGRFSVMIFGKPKLIGKNILILRLSNRKSYIDFKIVFHVKALKFLDYHLPDALELFKQYSTRIHFYNPTTLKPKFSYNFPIEFGQVRTEDEDGIDFTTIKFSPSKEGKYKFFVSALSPNNILLGFRTLHIKVINRNKAIAPVVNTPTVKAVDIKDWK